MLIAHVNPILQVAHARGGQHKYSGHTINFPQDITSIAKYLPRLVSELDILIMRRQNPSKTCYEFIISKSCVLASLEYKLIHDPYYRDVELYPSPTSTLLYQPTDISYIIHNVTMSSFIPQETIIDSTHDPDALLTSFYVKPSSFVPIILNLSSELDHIRAYLHSTNPNSTNSIDWPTIYLSPINEYTTEGLFSMELPTLFPTGIAMIAQPRITKVEMHKYVLHLLRYHGTHIG